MRTPAERLFDSWMLWMSLLAGALLHSWLGHTYIVSTALGAVLLLVLFLAVQTKEGWR